EFAQRRAHETRLRANGHIANFAFELGSSHERRDRVYHDHVQRVRSNERFANPKRFFTGARLRNEQVVEINAELFRVLRIERMLDVDESSKPAALLRLCDDGKGERCFPRGFGPEYFDNTPTWEAAHPESAVDENVARGYHVDIDDFF